MREVRNTNFEIRAIEPESRTVTGYALVFNTESTGISGFTEVIAPTALDGVLERSDVLCYLTTMRIRVYWHAQIKALVVYL